MIVYMNPDTGVTWSLYEIKRAWSFFYDRGETSMTFEDTLKSLVAFEVDDENKI